MRAVITIGIFCQDDVRATAQTVEACEALIALSQATVRVVGLLPAGNHAHRDQLERHGWPCISSAPHHHTHAHAYNALVSREGDVHLFMEAGVRLSADALARLLALLDEHPGVAVPSLSAPGTPQSMPGWTLASDGSPEGWSARVASWYAGQWRTMEPDYEIAPACVAVSAEVTRRVGGADTGYLSGSLWLVDLVVRAARAGWRTRWALDALAHAPSWRGEPISASGRRADRRLFDKKFCKCAGFERCARDRCPHFARLETAQLYEQPRATPARPLVSCLLVSGGDRERLREAIRQYAQQDYTDRELILVYDHPDALPDDLSDPSIMPVEAPPGADWAAMWDLACSAACGDLLVLWSEGAWSHPHRLSAQVEALEEAGAELIALRGCAVVDAMQRVAWTLRADAERPWAHGAPADTLMFARRFWDEGARFVPGRTLMDSAERLMDVLIYKHDAALVWRDGHHLFATLGEEGALAGGRAIWQEAPMPEALTALFTAPARVTPIRPATARPTVSCIMTSPAHPELLERAIRQFLRQGYAARELVVLDPSAASRASLIPDDERILYVRVEPWRALASQRQLSMGLASGELIMHWRGEDWYAPHWIEAQVDALLGADADVCGLSQLFRLDPHQARAWRLAYQDTATRTPHQLHEGTLCYRRDAWPSMSASPRRARMIRCVAHQRDDAYLSLAHPSVPTSPPDGISWTPCDPTPLLARFHPDAPRRSHA